VKEAKLGMQFSEVQSEKPLAQNHEVQKLARELKTSESARCQQNNNKQAQQEKEMKSCLKTSCKDRKLIHVNETNVLACT